MYLYPFDSGEKIEELGPAAEARIDRIPCIFPVIREFCYGDQFVAHCVRYHAIRANRGFRETTEKVPEFGDLRRVGPQSVSLAGVYSLRRTRGSGRSISGSPLWLRVTPLRAWPHPSRQARWSLPRAAEFAARTCGRCRIQIRTALALASSPW